jgi:hypothetical protein
MKTAQALPTQEETPWASLDRAFWSVINMPKEELLKEEAKKSGDGRRIGTRNLPKSFQ